MIILFHLLKYQELNLMVFFHQDLAFHDVQARYLNKIQNKLIFLKIDLINNHHDLNILKKG